MNQTELKRSSAKALRVTAPVAMAYLPLGMALGAYASFLDFPLYVAPITAFLVYAGSMEFLLLGMIAGGAGVIQIATSTLLVNSRHALYAFSYPHHLLKHWFARIYGPFALTDETYALISGGFNPKDENELIAAELANHIYWVPGAFIGALMGSFIPESFDGFKFSLTGLFVLLFLGSYKQSDQKIVTILAAVLGIIPALLLPKDYFLIAAILTFTLIIFVIVKIKQKEQLT
ncbi:AzlC family ABC transporter permease [uncultured Corynebacterium sp.]|uniref:AzlC family ABC transporter permease n=1 Tax=uncultured Corynebacterium sp. TaxID=159447 RepID=UPI0025E47C23|nr:AzlC family ABC transporter permease [uncultured Corynebacterium sp.]